MDCSKRMDLGQAFESGRSKYNEARSAAFFQVSTDLAARKKVDMARKVRSRRAQVDMHPVPRWTA
jgi:hypothetical protein